MAICIVATIEEITAHLCFVFAPSKYFFRFFGWRLLTIKFVLSSMVLIFDDLRRNLRSDYVL